MISQYQLNKFNKTFTHPVSVVTTYTLEKIIKIHHTQSSKAISQIIRKLAAILMHFMHDFTFSPFGPGSPCKIRFEQKLKVHPKCNSCTTFHCHVKTPVK